MNSSGLPEIWPLQVDRPENRSSSMTLPQTERRGLDNTGKHLKLCVNDNNDAGVLSQLALIWVAIHIARPDDPLFATLSGFQKNVERMGTKAFVEWLRGVVTRESWGELLEHGVFAQSKVQSDADQQQPQPMGGVGMQRLVDVLKSEFLMSHPRSPSKPLPIGEHITPRTELVELLDQRLTEARIIQIRGCPACGKSTLRNLLHVRLKERNVLVYTIDGWRTNKPHMERLQEICGAFDSNRPTYLLFDDAQDTYRDSELWNSFFKNVKGMTNIYVALFCSYGSASSRITDSTPDRFEEYQRVSLFPTPQTPFGLYLSHHEFEDLLLRYPYTLNLADGVKRQILVWSAGHIGAIEYLLESIQRKHAASMCRGTEYQLTMFLDEHPLSKIGHEFPQTSYGRGLPEFIDLHNDPSMTAMFRLLLRNGQIFEDYSEIGNVIQRAHKLGYIYSKVLRPSKQGFVLATPLHTASLAWMLIPAEVDLPSDLTELVLKVLERFKYSQMTLPI